MRVSVALLEDPELMEAGERGVAESLKSGTVGFQRFVEVTLAWRLIAPPPGIGPLEALNEMNSLSSSAAPVIWSQLKARVMLPPV